MEYGGTLTHVRPLYHKLEVLSKEDDTLYLTVCKILTAKYRKLHKKDICTYILYVHIEVPRYVFTLWNSTVRVVY